MARIFTTRQLREARAGTAWRREPFDRRAAYARRRGIPVSGRQPSEVNDALERILGEPDLLPARWFREGLRCADAVARIETPEGFGTGFLVAPDLLMTNHHVLPHEEIADGSAARFRFEADSEGNITSSRQFQLAPEQFFVTSPMDELDYTVVAVRPRPDGEVAGETFGVIPLIGATGKILLGLPVNIIQHPAGRPREVAIRNNFLLTVDDATRVTYLTDTEPGSSGSPVFNDRWDLVALHHSGVPALDADGRQIDLNGDPITRATPDDQRRWIANEGIRVSAIVADLARRELADEQRGFLDALLGRVGRP
jgi:endonuclease G